MLNTTEETCNCCQYFERGKPAGGLTLSPLTNSLAPGLRSTSGTDASRQAGQDGADNTTVGQMTGIHASPLDEDDIAATCLFSRSHHHNAMSCHIKILKLVNLESHQYSPAAGTTAAITITLKVWSDKCQQEHWLADWARF